MVTHSRHIFHQSWSSFVKSVCCSSEAAENSNADFANPLRLRIGLLRSPCRSCSKLLQLCVLLTPHILRLPLLVSGYHQTRHHGLAPKSRVYTEQWLHGACGFGCAAAVPSALRRPSVLLTGTSLS
ncbi:hypothetical protein LEMLEM_LOCUS19311 [Lemmus lemmus]